MRGKSSSYYLLFFTIFFIPLVLYFPHASAQIPLGDSGGSGGGVPVSYGPKVKKDERWPIVLSDYGKITAVKISNGINNGFYYLQFITMQPQSMLLPVQLYSEMILHVNSGNGTLSWIDINEDDYQLQQINLQAGDIYRLQPLTVVYLENNLESDEALQICALFPDSEQELQNKQLTGVYAGIHDLVLGFDNKVLRAILSVPEEVVQELRGGERQPLIVQIQPEANNSILEVNSRVIRVFLGLTKNSNIFDLVNKKKKKKNKKKKDKKKKDKKLKEEEEKEAYNLFKADHDFENENGWSVTVTSEHFDALKDSNFGVFMVNLTEGSMNGPHSNPASAELAIVQRGQGMVQVVCPSIPSERICKNSRFKVEEGDVFVVPRYHLMAQMSFSNESFVFMGFTMTSNKNPPQYLAGKKSFLQTLDKTVLAKSFDVHNTTMMDEVLSTEEVSIILECKSCAEDKKKLMEEEAVWERVDIGGDKVSHWGDMEGDSRGWQWAESEGEMARRQEEDMQRRLMVAEQAAKRARIEEQWLRKELRRRKAAATSQDIQ